MCHAVYTHLTDAQIERSLERVAAVMRPGGVFVFTYNLSGTGEVIHRGRLYAEQMPLISAHLADDGVFRTFAEERGAVFEPFDAIPHPGQTCSMLRFADVEAG